LVNWRWILLPDCHVRSEGGGVVQRLAQPERHAAFVRMPVLVEFVVSGAGECAVALALPTLCMT